MKPACGTLRLRQDERGDLREGFAGRGWFSWGGVVTMLRREKLARPRSAHFAFVLRVVNGGIL